MPAEEKAFTEEPEGGWLHDDEALALKGVFYNFPVIVRCCMGTRQQRVAAWAPFFIPSP